ncbi:50S ribosomal protein L35 [candidate division KSB1 bacterium]|nr:50S ribosomal protein L35 [candidate division KSB1 bacterium]
MPKMKSHRGAAKRFRLTAKGKVKRNKAYASHCLSGKSSKQKRNLTQSAVVDKSNTRKVKTILPYAN